MKRILTLTALLGLSSCESDQDKAGITPGQTLTLAGSLLDQYQAQRRANLTSAKTALNVQPVPVAEPLPEGGPGWLEGALMLFGLWK